MTIEPEILEYYAQNREGERLTAGPPVLELLRTQLLLQRFLPAPPARVVEVGGATGVYASWLAGLGYDVDLIDPVPLHIEQASAVGGFRAELGDARALPKPDQGYDAVLLLGPLYHLTERADRVLAFTEAARVVRPGGLVIAAAISRYASTLEGYFLGLLDQPGFTSIMRQDLATGQHRNSTDVGQYFTTAFFHTPEELSGEIVDAGLSLETVLPVEGPLNWAPGIRERLADPEQRQLVFDVLDRIEQDPTMTAATSHFLAVARRP
jgi:SAM-dependent methyltransferase